MASVPAKPSTAEHAPYIAALLERAYAVRYTDSPATIAIASQALEAAERTEKMPECVRALRIRGAAYVRLDDIDAACRDLERAEELNAALRHEQWKLRRDLGLCNMLNHAITLE